MRRSSSPCGARIAASSAAPNTSGSDSDKKKAKQEATKEKQSRKAESAVNEKRQRRYRPRCPAGVQQRIVRARSQRLFLIERTQLSDVEWSFVVLGSTGNVYTVRIAHLPSCSCPDHQKGNVCKHILFVWIKVMGLSEMSQLIYQNALISSELNEAFGQMHYRMCQIGRGVLANDNVRSTYQKLTAPKQGDHAEAESFDEKDEVRRQPVEGDCPICFDPLDGAIVFCRAACGVNLHKTCMDAWKHNKNGETLTCPNCRSNWIDDGASKTKKYSSPEGYTNLGSLQGQSTQRDTSTYSEWYGYHPRDHKRRRR